VGEGGGDIECLHDKTVVAAGGMAMAVRAVWHALISGVYGDT
jgi:hypothetical protein